MQSIVRLPKTAYLKLGLFWLRIKNHKTTMSSGMAGWMLCTIRFVSKEKFIESMKQHEISFEAAVETCNTELENTTKTFEDILYWYFHIKNVPNASTKYSKSEAGITMAEEIIEKIRDCGDWEGFYDGMNEKSDFYMKMKKKINVEIKEYLEL